MIVITEEGFSATGLVLDLSEAEILMQCLGSIDFTVLRHRLPHIKEVDSVVIEMHSKIKRRLYG